MKSRELRNLGIPQSLIADTIDLIRKARGAGFSAADVRATIRGAATQPSAYVNHDHFGALATALLAEDLEPVWHERETPAPWTQYGSDLDEAAVRQLENACRLPVAVRGALMPDAHVGYGLPIGGVLATENAVIPYAVGVDIACRMKLTVLDMPLWALKGEKDRLIKTIESETRFGIGAAFRGRDRREHDVLEERWDGPVTKGLKDKAWAQLGTSGSGNHFVEFGTLELAQDDLGLKAGTYLALLSHSGSRGAGATVAGYYSKLAQSLHPELPKELRHLAWLDLDSEEGHDYWQAMNLMGRYAAANHAMIHEHVAKSLGAKVLLDVENHHNFAWKEDHDGTEVVVHRKGATPAGNGVLGIIPGSMAAPGFVVRGRGEANSLQSASHGAGRVMSRTKAKEIVHWSKVKKRLDEKGVTLISAGIDEAPDVYKDIHDVMAAQSQLVDVVARFDPKIVKMAPAGEPPED
ncbi:MAG: RtcB family protein [bacterium]